MNRRPLASRPPILPGLACVAAALLGCAASPPGPSPSPIGPLPESTLPSDELAAVVEAERQRQRLVGLGVGVVLDGRVAWLGGFGYADRGAEVPLDPTKHRIRWASISKTVTGTIAARQATRAGLPLDVDVRTIWPDWPGPTQVGLTDPRPWQGTITLRQLLSHTAGVQTYGDGADPTPPLEEQLDPTVNTGFAWALPRWWTAPLVSPPGTAFHYSSLGHNLAGAVVGAHAARTGEAPDAAFFRLIEELLAGTGAQGVQPDRETAPLPHRAAGYRLADDSRVYPSLDVDVSWKTPGGGLISTVQELAAYCALLAGDELMTADEKALAWRMTPLPGGVEDYGLGFGIGERDGRRRVEHNGGQEKTRTRLVLYPDEGLCVISMTNTETASVRYPIDLMPLTDRLEDVLRAARPTLP